jgi:hypothetical protein
MDFETANALSERYTAIDLEADSQKPKAVGPEGLSSSQRYDLIADSIIALAGGGTETLSRTIMFEDPLLHQLTLRVELVQGGDVSSVIAHWDSSAPLDVEEYVDLSEIQELDESVADELDESVAEDINRRLGLIEESIAEALKFIGATEETGEETVVSSETSQDPELVAQRTRDASNEAIRSALAEEPNPSS